MIDEEYHASLDAGKPPAHFVDLLQDVGRP